MGPVKGVYQPGQGLSPSAAKVRGHSLMLPERPGCVTLLALVRDAAARLPNGEGTRAEICELMKQSQYLAPGADASLHSVVSGALDRLHYEADPCVKYDSARKVWIYLHRHRTESEFGMFFLEVFWETCIVDLSVFILLVFLLQNNCIYNIRECQVG